MFIAATMSFIMTVSIAIGAELDSWRAINDGVMGGVSHGGMIRSGDDLIFRGELSLENNGGFASVRRLVRDDLTSAAVVRLKVRGDGRDYQFRIRLDDRFDGVVWRAVFVTTGEWQTVDLPLDAFEPVFRGYRVPDAGPVIADKISQIGFLIADKQPGPFSLEIRSIQFLEVESQSRL